ncbi:MULTISPECIES: copper-binding protein [Sphingomonas]|uniref:copper-binding protein n=1 Tax=Sphingomonas TaxID=13687 RepID=UPI0009EA5505|nr:copper-binding protein [Sphingomonas sp. CCH10-B3]
MSHRMLLAVALPLVIAGCGKPAPQAPGPDNGSMAGMNMSSEAKSSHGSGTVTKIDADSGEVTLQHGPVTELGWPAMTMTFSGKPGTMDGLKVGDKVDFAFDWDGKTGRLTSITKR